MRILIDGHNALFALKVKGKTHEEQRHALLRLVGAVAPAATVYFDARDAPADAWAPYRELGVKVVYCQHREADAAILAEAREGGGPMLVVSNDRELRGIARQHGARTQTVREFFGADPVDEEFKSMPDNLPRYKPKDFDLPDFVDLEDYEDDGDS